MAKTESLRKLEDDLSRLSLSPSTRSQTEKEEISKDILRLTQERDRLRASEAVCWARMKEADAEMGLIRVNLETLERRHKEFRNQPETRFLKDVAASFRSYRNYNALIPRLEKLLRQLLDQSTLELYSSSTPWTNLTAIST